LLRAVAKHLADVTHPKRYSGWVVDYDVPRLATKRIELVEIAIPTQRGDTRRQEIVTPSAIEDGDLVSSRERVPHLMRTCESGTAKDEDLQRFWSAWSRGADRCCAQRSSARSPEGEHTTQERGIAQELTTISHGDVELEEMFRKL
jgi:hypothetical protein